MQQQIIRIGTRDSELAVWQATHVQKLLHERNLSSELIYIKSEGDVDLHTPLYEMGVQGIFTKTLDIALLNNRIDIAVHSLKDVPTRLPEGISQAAVLKRGNVRDIFVPHPRFHSIEHFSSFSLTEEREEDVFSKSIIASSSVRRRAQWLNRYPDHQFVNLRGNVNTRLQKLHDSDWDGAIFAAAGVERINLRPGNTVDLDWMLPAPAQGAIVVVCRTTDDILIDYLSHLNHQPTEICTKAERDFLRALGGGCSTPIGALATIDGEMIRFRGNVLSANGKVKVEVEKHELAKNIIGLGERMAEHLVNNGGREVVESLKRND